MDKSGIIYLTVKEAEDFRDGKKIPKLGDWELSLEEFNNMICSKQIIIIDKDDK